MVALAVNAKGRGSEAVASVDSKAGHKDGGQ